MGPGGISLYQTTRSIREKMEQYWQLWIMKAVMLSAAEVELGAFYINAKEAIYNRQILEVMGHKQPWTPIITDSSRAERVVNSRIQPKHTKAIKMMFHWQRDHEVQKHFHSFWHPGADKKADYSTKHHFAAHHKRMCNELLTSIEKICQLRVWANYRWLGIDQN